MHVGENCYVVYIWAIGTNVKINQCTPGRPWASLDWKILKPMKTIIFSAQLKHERVLFWG